MKKTGIFFIVCAISMTAQEAKSCVPLANAIKYSMGGHLTQIGFVLSLAGLTALKIWKLGTNTFSAPLTVIDESLKMSSGEFVLRTTPPWTEILARARAGFKEIIVEGAKETYSTLSPYAKEAYTFLRSWAGTIDLRKYSGKALEALTVFVKKGLDAMSPSQLVAARVALGGTAALGTSVATGIFEEAITPKLEMATETIKKGINQKDFGFAVVATIIMNGLEGILSVSTQCLASLAPFIP